MLISDIKMLEIERERLGEVEVIMQGTLLPDGFSECGSVAFPSVFTSTVESCRGKVHPELGHCLELFWQI